MATPTERDEKNAFRRNGSVWEVLRLIVALQDGLKIEASLRKKTKG
jgi:hypothetical protein